MPPPNESGKAEVHETARARRANNRALRKAAQSDPLQTAEEALQRNVEEQCNRARTLRCQMQQFIDDTQSKLQDPAMSIDAIKTQLSKSSGFQDDAKELCAALHCDLNDSWKIRSQTNPPLPLDGTAHWKNLSKLSKQITALADKAKEIPVDILRFRYSIQSRIDAEELEEMGAEDVFWETKYGETVSWGTYTGGLHRFHEAEASFLRKYFPTPHKMVQFYNVCGGNDVFRTSLTNILKQDKWYKQDISDDLWHKMSQLCRAFYAQAMQFKRQHQQQAQQQAQ